MDRASSHGLAYYVTDGPNTTQANFYIYDIATGTQVGTLPSPFTGSGTFAVLAVPEPTVVVLAVTLGLGGAATAWRIRKRRITKRKGF